MTFLCYFINVINLSSVWTTVLLFVRWRYTWRAALEMKSMVFWRASTGPCSFSYIGAGVGQISSLSNWWFLQSWRMCCVVWSASPQGHMGEPQVQYKMVSKHPWKPIIYVLNPISQKFPQCCFWNSCNVQVWLTMTLCCGIFSTNQATTTGRWSQRMSKQYDCFMLQVQSLNLDKWRIMIFF